MTVLAIFMITVSGPGTTLHITACKVIRFCRHCDGADMIAVSGLDAVPYFFVMAVKDLFTKFASHFTSVHVNACR